MSYSKGQQLKISYSGKAYVKMCSRKYLMNTLKGAGHQRDGKSISAGMTEWEENEVKKKILMFRDLQVQCAWSIERRWE